ncbi:glycosyltransferase [Candidatus Woesebacteria bacterium]|nr:glycosyltransferase [Candidatus Woesebacteria bacterium]
MQTTQPSVALVYDHLITSHGGAEYVLESLWELFPQLELFTTVYDPTVATWARHIPIHTSFLQWALPLMKIRELLDICTPIAIEQFDLSKFDIVISVTSSAVKGVITHPKQLHICYLLTPTRYLYHDSKALLTSHPIASLPGIKQIAASIFTYLRWWDQVAIHRPDAIIAISQHVSSRISTFYDVTANEIIYPPVPTYTHAELSKKNLFANPYYLVISRLMPYKRIDLAIDAAIELKTSLVIIGEGREMKRLIEHAAAHACVRKPRESLAEFLESVQKQQTAYSICFVGNCTTAEKAQLLTHCELVIQPGIEDFGITAIEAVFCGKPVVISHESGVAELLEDGVTAIHLSEQSTPAVVTAIQKAKSLSINKKTISDSIQMYSAQAFGEKFSKFLFAFKQEHSTI